MYGKNKVKTTTGCTSLLIIAVFLAFLFTTFALFFDHANAQPQEQSYQLQYDSIMMPSAPAPEPMPGNDDDAEYIHRLYAKLCDKRAFRLSLYAGDEFVRSDPVPGDKCFEPDTYEYVSIGPEPIVFTFVIHYPTRNYFCEVKANTGVCNLWGIHIPHVEKSDVALVTPTPERNSEG